MKIFPSLFFIKCKLEKNFHTIDPKTEKKNRYAFLGLFLKKLKTIEHEKINEKELETLFKKIIEKIKERLKEIKNKNRDNKEDIVFIDQILTLLEKIISKNSDSKKIIENNNLIKHKCISAKERLNKEERELIKILKDFISDLQNKNDKTINKNLSLNGLIKKNDQNTTNSDFNKSIISKDKKIYNGITKYIKSNNIKDIREKISKQNIKSYFEKELHNPHDQPHNSSNINFSRIKRVKLLNFENISGFNNINKNVGNINFVEDIIIYKFKHYDLDNKYSFDNFTKKMKKEKGRIDKSIYEIRAKPVDEFSFLKEFFASDKNFSFEGAPFESKNTHKDISETHILKEGLLKQVSDGILQAFNTLSHRVTLKLYPPELGRMVIVLKFHKKEVSADIRTENQKVADFIKGNVASIEDALVRHGFKIHKVEIRSMVSVDNHFLGYGSKDYSKNKGQEDTWKERERALRLNRVLSLHRADELAQIMLKEGEEEKNSFSSKGLYVVI